MLIHSPQDLAVFVLDQRKKLKMSQTEVSNLVGLQQKTISALENNPESIKLETLFRILSALNLDMKLFKKDETKVKWKQEW